MRQDIAWSAALPMLLAVVILVPFLGKAFTIDDVTFLLEARHALVDPLHPGAFEMVFDGERIWLSRYMASGPVMAYMLAPFVNSLNAEYYTHTTQLVLCLAGLVATASLCLRIGLNRVQAALATLMVVASPAILGMTSTVMPDTPAMAFGVIGVERFVAWHQERKWHSAVAAAFFLALACLSRSHTIALIPVSALLALFLPKSVNATHHQRMARGTVQFFSLLLAVLLVALVIVVTRDEAAGRNLAVATALRIHSDKIFFNLPSYFMHCALAFPFALMWPVARGTHFLKIWRTCVAFVIAIPLAYTGDYFNHGTVWGVVLLLALTLSIDVFLDMTVDAMRRGDKVQLVLLLWLLAPSAAVVYVQLPPKLLLFSAPAMGILVARRIDWSSVADSAKWYAGGVLCAGLIIGTLVLETDQAFAEIGRFGGKIAAQQVAAGNNVWSNGSWGFNWYTMEAGAKPVAVTAPFPQPGDIVVSGPKGEPVPDPRGKLLYQKIYSAPGGRIQSDGAGFFTNGAGPLPWTWGRSEIARIEVRRVE